VKNNGGTPVRLIFSSKEPPESGARAKDSTPVGPFHPYLLTILPLRSRRDGPDVSLIAAFFGGGGHPNAAGFHTDLGADALGLTPCRHAGTVSQARTSEAAAV
jgi:hypothetical protein